MHRDHETPERGEVADRTASAGSTHRGMRHDMSADMRACVDACTSCHHQCVITLAHVLERGAPLATPALAEALLDCARTCEMSADFLLRGSERHTRVCELCEEVCRACETACASTDDGETLRRCADACATCAASCERMAAMA